MLATLKAEHSMGLNVQHGDQAIMLFLTLKIQIHYLLAINFTVLFLFYPTILEKLLDANWVLSNSRSEELKLLRLYGKTHERMDFSGPYTSHGYLESSDGEGRCLDEFKGQSLHHLIRNNCCELKKMENMFNKMRKESAVPTPEMLMEYQILISKREKEIIGQEYDVILATCNECAGARISNLRDEGRVAQVIVDECGMAHEPETIAAVSLSEHVVLIGDHKQLQPVIKHPAARQNGLSTSLFQRYAEKFDENENSLLVALKTQYRMVSAHVGCVWVQAD